MGLQDAPCRWWDAASDTEGSQGVVWGQLWGQRGQQGRVRSQGVIGGHKRSRGYGGQWGLGAPGPPPAGGGTRPRALGGHGGLYGVSCGVSGVVWGHRGSLEVIGSQGNMGVIGGWGHQDPPLQAVGHGLGHWGAGGGQLWGQQGQRGGVGSQGVNGVRGIRGSVGQMGLQDPHLQVAGHGLGHWGGTWGQLWGQRGRVGSQGVPGGHRRGEEVRGVWG